MLEKKPERIDIHSAKCLRWGSHGGRLGLLGFWALGKARSCILLVFLWDVTYMKKVKPADSLGCPRVAVGNCVPIRTDVGCCVRMLCVHHPINSCMTNRSNVWAQQDPAVGNVVGVVVGKPVGAAMGEAACQGILDVACFGKILDPKPVKFKVVNSYTNLSDEVSFSVSQPFGPTSCLVVSGDHGSRSEISKTLLRVYLDNYDLANEGHYHSLRSRLMPDYVTLSINHAK